MPAATVDMVPSAAHYGDPRQADSRRRKALNDIPEPRVAGAFIEPIMAPPM